MRVCACVYVALDYHIAVGHWLRLNECVCVRVCVGVVTIRYFVCLTVLS